LNNREIIKILRTTASLLELYGENQFKVRSYQTAVYNLERTSIKLTELDNAELAKLPGVGKSIANTIQEINQDGSSSTLDNLLKQTPEGIQELLKIKGLGARKIKTVWDELGIVNAEDLLSAASNGMLADLPGFGAKTQEKILQMVAFHLRYRNHFHYKTADILGESLENAIKENFPEARLYRTGAFRRKLEVLTRLEYLWPTNNVTNAIAILDQLQGLSKNPNSSGPLKWAGELVDEIAVKLEVRFCHPSEYGTKQVYYTGSIAHLHYANQQEASLWSVLHQQFDSEEEVYQQLGLPVYIPELREGLFEKEFSSEEKQQEIIVPENLKGILHNHSTYSDGKHSLEEMARSCMEFGYEYFGITDHSQTAVYANGLDEEKLRQQWEEIDRLNEQLAPFRIFKGIESDILNDGSLDYQEAVLEQFDFIVASIHFNINMDEDQATKRLIKAIENPFTTILGHPTGRQLLKREGYPINHEKVIDACAENEVVIEINAHPWRLDIDWRWVRQAVDKGVLISINPDAHETAGIEDVLYGTNVARKAGLPASMTFNAMDLKGMDQYLIRRKKAKV